MHFKYFKLNIYVLLVATFFLACSSSDNGSTTNPPVDNTPSTIIIAAQNSYTGIVNETFQLTATVRNSNGNILSNQSLSWSSSDTSVATISNSGSLSIVDSGQITITVAIGSIEDSININIRISPPNLLAFTIADLSNELAAQGGTTITFLDEPTMSANLLELVTGETNSSTSSSRDQVYYFFEGNGTMDIDGENVVVTEESTVFITANSSRSITTVSTDMKVIITEVKTGVSQWPLAFRSFSYSQMEAPRSLNQNIWNPFLNEESVVFGLYMLPQVAGGDGRLVHGWDELNIITRGSSTFQTDEGNVQVSPGSIVFVRESNGHAFNNLSANIDILILWNM